nr:Transposase, MuDR, plant [Ipomoea batatas]
MCSVELVIHHGGNFVKDTELKYINGDVWEVDIDPDLLSYPHLVKFIKEDQYGKIETLYYKALHEPLDKLRVLWNDASVLDLTEVAIKYRSCDIYVDHGIDDADLIPCYMLPGCEEGNVEGTTDVNEEIGEGDCTVGEEQTEGFHGVCDEVNEYSSDEGNETSSDEGNENSCYEGNEDSGDEGNEDSDDEGNEGDEDSNDSEFENDFGGVTQEDNTHIYEGAAKGKGVEVKAKVKTTKAKASEVKEVEGEACNDEYYYDSEDPPTEESEEEVVTQTVTPPRKKCKLPSYNPECNFPKLEKGMLFEDAKQFKTAMIMYAVHFKRDIYLYKNESRRVRVKCVEGCPFVCHCSWEERYRCFQLKTCILDHRCNCKYKLKMLTQKWLEEKYEDLIVKEPTMQHTKLRDHIQTELKINITISMVRRAQTVTISMVIKTKVLRFLYYVAWRKRTTSAISWKEYKCKCQEEAVGHQLYSESLFWMLTMKTDMVYFVIEVFTRMPNFEVFTTMPNNVFWLYTVSNAM